jgi:hypothetical protein
MTRLLLALLLLALAPAMHGVEEPPLVFEQWGSITVIYLYEVVPPASGTGPGTRWRHHVNWVPNLGFDGYEITNLDAWRTFGGGAGGMERYNIYLRWRL